MTQSDVSRSMAPLLESQQDQFASLCGELEHEIQPKGAIERTYVHDIASLICESQRFRRYKTVLINNCRLAALQGILEQLLSGRDYDRPFDKDLDAAELARNWFTDKEAQARVTQLLRQFQMDETAIEAEAFRLCAEDVERLDRMVALAEVRRDRALRSIADYRQSLAKQIKKSTDRILDNDDVPRLVSRSG